MPVVGAPFRPILTIDGLYVAGVEQAQRDRARGDEERNQEEGLQAPARDRAAASDGASVRRVCEERRTKEQVGARGIVQEQDATSRHYPSRSSVATGAAHEHRRSTIESADAVGRSLSQNLASGPFVRAPSRQQP